MSFFKRILRFKKETIAQQEQRHAQRYPLNADSPLQCVLQLGHRHRSGQVINLSGTGVSLRTAKDLEATRDQACRLTFSLGKYQLAVDATVAHSRAADRHLTLGLALKFAGFEIQKSYLQLLEPIAIGTTLAPASAGLLRETEPGIITDRYYSPGDAQLTIWRNFAGQSVHGFEFRMRDYFVRSHGAPPNLEIYTCEESQPGRQGYAGPALRKAGDKTAEIRQLFRWVVPHLSKTVPDDARSFLGQFTA